jgi:hypothetical protein
MQTQMFNWRTKPLLKDEKGNYLKNPDGTFQRGEEQVTSVQGALRPIQLFEYVFPEECLPEVLAMMNLHKDYNNLRPEVAKLAWLLRKGLGAQKIPEMPEIQNKSSLEITRKFVPTSGVAVYPLGIKTDPKKDYPEFGTYQEGL